jgi:hypothetical protein
MGKSRITLETEVLKIYSLVAVALGGGTASLSLIRPITLQTLLLTAVGAFLTLVFVIAAVAQYFNVRKLADRMED